MQGCFPQFRIGCLLLSCLATCFSAVAAEIPSSWIDDAQLHDVKSVGSKLAFAVGEHGAIWKSIDGGRNWTESHCGMDVSLQSICLLDDRTGWVAGRNTTSYSGLDNGVLLATQDGGKTWQQLARDVLPALSHVKFFGLEEGLVVGQPTSLSPTGIFRTNDGGKTWRGVQGEATHSWKAMCFLEPEMGVVAGVQGRVSVMGGEQLYPSKLQPQGFRTIRSIGLLSNDKGWLVGDGGLILSTATSGVVWESPQKPLPEELRDGMDFRAVEVRNEKVWIAGSPGSAIWHSPDGGLRWEKQLTGQTAPLAALRFANEQQGIAVGAFGVIVRTEDGGKTWQTARGAGRHAALLALHARPGKTSAPLLTKLSGEMGFRSAVWIAQRDDIGPMAWSTESESILHAAVQKCGGNRADVHWQLPLTLPGIEFSSDKLLAEWQKQTEGRLPQTFLGAIVRQIRTWRPNVVIIDQPSSDDAAGQLMFDATLRAVAQAADGTRYAEQSQFTGLDAWKVDRIYMRLATGGTGDAHIDLDELLPSLKASTRNAAAPAVALLQANRVPVSEANEAPRIAYRWIGLDGKTVDESSLNRRGKSLTSREFFGGLSIAPGSPSRRDSVPIDETNLERMQKLAQKQRNFTGLFQKSLDDPRVAGQMIGQINAIVEGMEPQQAVGVLRDLADEYRKRSQFELVESTYVELIRRYPKEPGSLDAMRWLIQFWCSSETAWQRTQTMKSDTSVTQGNSKQVQRVQQAFAQSNDGNGGVNSAGGLSDGSNTITRSSSASPIRLKTQLDLEATDPRDKKSRQPGRLKIDRDVEWRTGAVADWHSRATELAKQLQMASPGRYQSAEIQFPLAALRRSDGSTRIADSIIRNFVTNPINPETKQLAERELWASFATPESPNSLALCYQTNERPHLDGLLSDPCWTEAKEIHLTQFLRTEESAGGLNDTKRTMAMFAYDNEFLYVGILVPREPGTPQDRPQLTGRQHDADLTRHDRISIRLDIDRDYATWYEFQVDQRGWTAESCWEDRRWNPTWYVAADMDETDWRIEAAIPWADLSPTPPRRSTIYGLSVLRTIPTVGLQSWTHPATARPQPSSFGLLKFE